jgi:hypothetical protein
VKMEEFLCTVLWIVHWVVTGQAKAKIRARINESIFHRASNVEKVER